MAIPSFRPKILENILLSSFFSPSYSISNLSKCHWCHLENTSRIILRQYNLFSVLLQWAPIWSPVFLSTHSQHLSQNGQTLSLPSAVFTVAALPHSPPWSLITHPFLLILLSLHSSHMAFLTFHDQVGRNPSLGSSCWLFLLRSDIRMCNSLTTLKFLLKLHLFNEAYSGYFEESCNSSPCPDSTDLLSFTVFHNKCHLPIWYINILYTV